MKRFRQLYITVITGLLTLAACSTDDASEQGVGLQDDGKVRVHLKVNAGGSPSTRAWSDSENAVTAEMMNVWTVVVVNNEEGANLNKVVSIYACKPSGEPDQEIDDYVELPTVGSYRFYSFANMSPRVVMSLLGIGGTGAATLKARTRGAEAGTAYADSPTGSTNGGGATGSVTAHTIDGDNFYTDDNTYSQNKYYTIAFGEGAVVAAATANAKTVNMAGNNFNVNATTNGFGAAGIPMSNVQTIDVTSTTESIDLIVIRMMAKIELQVYNDGASDVTIESITLTDVTANTDGNLKLLPNLTSGANTMDNQHKDIKPNLGTVTKKDLTLYPTPAQGVVAAIGHKTTDGTPNPVKFTFYVNESAAPTNASGLFYVILGTRIGSNPVEYSYALISQKGSTTTDDGAWDYIARNDYRQIPIVLTDWQFRIEPIAFTPIAGYPAKTLSSDALKATFSTGGFIALKPYVKKRSESTWRDFQDPEVTYGEEVKVGGVVDDDKSWAASITWKNIDGDSEYCRDKTDNDEKKKIVMTPFTYDPVSNYLIGELNNEITESGTYKTAVTVKLKLENKYTYSFTCDVILEK